MFEGLRPHGAQRAGSSLTALTTGSLLAAIVVTSAVSACGDSGVPTDDGPGDPNLPTLAPPPPDWAQAVGTITSDDLAARIGQLSHDSMMGRWTPSPELVKAAVYAAGEFDRLGLETVSSGTPSTCSDEGIPVDLCPYLQWFASPAEVNPDAMNVVGVLRGSDTVLRNQYVVIGAHFDHIGTGPPVAGDSIFNGADDNASGTAAVLELAEAFAALDAPPRRSILFILFSGEELGLLGSWHFTSSPEAPIPGTVAMINLDMIGRNWSNMVGAVSQLVSDIFVRAEQVSDAHPELGMELLHDPWPDQNLINRSDQAPFTLYGIPVLFLTSGLHDDYHKLTDEAGKIDYEKTTRLTRLVFWLLWEFGETDQPPVLPL